MKRTVLALAVIMLAGATLRVTQSWPLTLWRDEAQFVAVASLPSLYELLAFLYHEESHPPLFYLLGRIGLLVGGVERVALAISLVASVTTIPLAYVAGRIAVSRLCGWLAAALVALSVPLAIYAPQLRPYSLLSCLYLASSIWLMRFAAERSSRVLWLWAASSIAALYTHHTALFVFMSQLAVVCLATKCLREPVARRAMARATVVVLICWLPSLVLLQHQARSAAYPAFGPFHVMNPIMALARLALQFPLEVLAVTTTALMSIATWRRMRASMQPWSGAIILIVPVTLALLLAASYRSQVLTTQVVLSLTPLGLVTAAAWPARQIAAGARWRALVSIELLVVAGALSWLLNDRYVETTMPSIARHLRDAGRDSDLIVLVPGAAGPSFNLYHRGVQQQINFPELGAVRLYSFSNDFERVTSEGAWDSMTAAVQRAGEQGRRVWFVSDIRWITPLAAAPARIPRDSLGGIGQADRARAARVYALLRWRMGAGSPAGVANRDWTGPEVYEAWLFTPTVEELR